MSEGTEQDLVQRLRHAGWKLKNWSGMFLGTSAEQVTGSALLYDQAADEIERLRAALAEARSACVGMSTFLTNEQLTWACDTWPWVGGDESARAAGGGE